MENGFWFVDLPRTSSTSIKIELAEKFGGFYSKSDIRFKTEGQIGTGFIMDHTRAIDVANIVGKKNWNKLFTFTVVRNPWERALSAYFFYCATFQTLFKKFKFSNLTFKGFLALAEQIQTKKYNPELAIFFRACDSLLDKDGSIMVKYVARYEIRDEEIKKIGEKIGFKQLGRLQIEKKSINKHYLEYYDDESIEMVRRIYAKDIELFDYKFESSDQIF